jgi:hypothetical protein
MKFIADKLKLGAGYFLFLIRFIVPVVNPPTEPIINNLCINSTGFIPSETLNNMKIIIFTDALQPNVCCKFSQCTIQL